MKCGRVKPTFLKTYASPAISGGRIFVRGFKNLNCIGTALN
jgi:hypothetical protein